MKNNLNDIEKVAGCIVLYKNVGISSRKEIDKVSRILKEKTGHIGTLDPNASGVLPCLIGKATKLSNYLITHRKKYYVEFVLGYETDTLDLEGKIVFKDDNLNNDSYLKYTDEEIIEGILKEKGKKKQIPPVFSAKKIDGKKLYDIAINDYDLALELATKRAKDITIYDIQDIVIKREEGGSNIKISLNLEVSGGTYIRAFVRDVAYNLGTYATVTKLERTSVANMTKVDAIVLEDDIRLEGLEKELEREKEKKIILDNIIPEEELLKEVTENSIYITEDRIDKFLNGLDTNMETRYGKYYEDGIYIVYFKKEIVGLGIVKNNNLRRDYIVTKYDK